MDHLKVVILELISYILDAKVSGWQNKETNLIFTMAVNSATAYF
jgi:hypothetical protein